MPISKHDKQALVQLFTDMGVPLITAMQTVESWGTGAKSQAERANELAKLLNISVEFSTKLTKKLDVRDAYTLEHIRGKIIRIVTPLVAEKYIQNGTIPEGETVDKLINLFDVLMSFSDSVSPTQDDKNKYDDIALFIEAVDPIMGIEADTKEISDIITTLIAKANGLAGPLNCANIYQTGLLKAITQVFITTYNAHETKQNSADIDAIWADCDEKLVIIQNLTGFVGTKIGIQPQTQATPPAAKPQEKPTINQVSKEKPKAKDNNETNKEDDDDDGEFNPMSFFG